MVLKKLAVVVGLFVVGFSICMQDSYAVKREKSKQESAKKEKIAGLKELKKVVAVANFKMENVQWGSDVAVNMGDMLVDKLVQSGKFIVVERDRDNPYDMTLSKFAEKEQAAKQAGISRGKGADAGKAAAAQALFVGSVVGAGEGSSFGGLGGAGGAGGVGLGGMGIGSNKVAIIVRWYDTTTLQIKGSKECSKTQASIGLFGGGYGGGAGGLGGINLRSTLHKTFSRAIDQCVDWIVNTMEKVPWEGKVIKAGKEVYINAGSEAGVAVGDSFGVYKAGEALVDPDSGLELGVEENLIGQVQVTKTMPKYSVATSISGNSFAKGDIIRQQ